MASHIWPPRELYKKLVDERDSPSWLALIELFNHPWFSRVWVIQEVAVASKVRLIYGGWVIHWDMLLSCLKLFVQPELQVLLTTTEDVNRRRRQPIALLNGLTIGTLRLLQGKKMDLKFSEVVFVCSTFESSDSRDKIYALQGIASDGSDPRLKIDYSDEILPKDVYLNTAKYLLTQEVPLCILHLAGIGYTRNLNDLPSWVPDWSSSPKPLAVRIGSNSIYRASGERNAEIRLDAHGETITVRGKQVDEVNITGEVFPLHFRFNNEFNTISNRDEFYLWYQDCRNLAELLSQDPYPNGQSFDEAFCGRSSVINQCKPTLLLKSMQNITRQC